MKTAHFLFLPMLIFLSGCRQPQAGISLTLIPPAAITNMVKLDIRAGISNTKKSEKKLEVSFYMNAKTSQNLLFDTTLNIAPCTSECVKFIMATADHAGVNTILLVVKEGKKEQRISKEITILNSDTRSPQTIDGAWVAIYHWSEQEGRRWNHNIKKVTDEQWKEMIRSMHQLNMNIVVVQEVFRNQEYIGKHNIDKTGYKGKAFYPSALYKNRMPIKAKDPIEAILSEADNQGMNVFLGVGLYAWFDFTSASLEWHKKVAKELWDMYGHHPSFYGFYVSEESGGSLDNWEEDEGTRIKRKAEIVNFFKEFKTCCNQFAPSKPIMLATNSMGIPSSEDTYRELLPYLDILCPFGFARMPKDDLTGEQAAALLQKYCDASGTHLWFDLEAFLTDQDGSLYPRPIEQIVEDLTRFNNFEKVICYQYPGVFNDPAMSISIGEPSATKLFLDYQLYIRNIKLDK
jgi:hypothetical protein